MVRKVRSLGSSWLVGLAALVMSLGAVGATAAISGDPDRPGSPDVQVEAAGAATSTTTAAEPHAHDAATHDDSTHDDSTHDDSTHDNSTHDDSTHDDATHDDATHDDATHDDATHDDATHDDPCDEHSAHTVSRASTSCPRPDPCPDDRGLVGLAATPCTPDPGIDPDPCEDHAHAALDGHTDDCTPDPCGADPAAEGCTTPDPCEDHHAAHATAVETECPAPQYDDLPDELKAMVDAGRDVAMQYPTAADASAAGWGQATIYFPGIAAHYLKAGLLDATFDPSQPEVLLYGQNGELVGVNYIVYNGATPPEGMPGDYDGWHEHPALCRSLTTGLVIGGENLSKEECAAIGGVLFSFKGFYLLHVWSIPDWQSPEGIFSHENSRI